MVLAVTIARQLGFSLERRSAEQARELLLMTAGIESRTRSQPLPAKPCSTRRLPSEKRPGPACIRLAKPTICLPARTGMREVVAHALMPFEGSHDRRLIVEGPPIALPARTSLMLTLCLHELATSAVKNGALSNGTGQVRIGLEPIADAEQRPKRGSVPS